MANQPPQQQTPKPEAQQQTPKPAETQQPPQQPSKVSELKDKFKQQLDDARKKVDQIKQEISGARAQDKQALSEKRDEIHQRIEAQKERGEEMRKDLKAWQAEKVNHTKDAISTWRKRRELAKLEKRADRAEESAVNMLIVAMLDAEAAEDAMLEAMAARIDFETATP
jgi:hypothetical protein